MQLMCYRMDTVFICIPHTDKYGPFRGQVLTCRELRLGKGPAEVSIYAHDLTSRFHFRAEEDIHVRKAIKRKHGLLDRNVIGLHLTGEPQIFQSPSQHDLGRKFRQLDTRGLAHKGDGS